MLTDDDRRMLTDAADTLEDADQAIRDATVPGCEPMAMARALRAIVDRPAPPAAQPPPVLDLDALAEAERAMTADLAVEAGNVEIGDTGEWDAYVHIVGRDGRVLVYMNSPEADRSLALARGIVALRNAAPHLIAEARAAVALRHELERLRPVADAMMFDKLVAGYRAARDEQGAEIARLTAELVAEQERRNDREAANRLLLAEVARMDAELAAARAVPPYVEATIDAFEVAAMNDADATATTCGDLRLAGNALRTTIARAISDATAGAVADFIDGHAKRLCEQAGEHWTGDGEQLDAWAAKVHDVLNHLRAVADGMVVDGRASQPATVGGLLATAPVVEYQVNIGARRGVLWRQQRHGMTRTFRSDESWGSWVNGTDEVPGHAARLVPAHLADADPASRGPIGEG